ncbi:MAG: four helix bundle protein [Bacteroidales bacterium]
MDNKEFAKNLEKRTLLFAVIIIKLCGKLPNTTEGKVIRNQLAKAGSSVGANYREANRSRSKADFKNKIKICESESSETNYWLQIITSLEWLNQKDIDWEYKESEELLAIFTSISKNLNR